VDGFLPEIAEIKESAYYSEGWKYGPPRGIMFHSGPLLYGSGASVHFTVGIDEEFQGKAFQHVSLLNRSWHASEASDYYFSIFHIEPLSIEQLKLSSIIAANIIRFTKEQWAMTVPIIRAPGPGFSPGFKEHRDGAGAAWNEKLHSDGLNEVWSWQQYLDNVRLELEEDDMALFENKEEFRKETLKAIVGANGDGSPRVESDQLVEGIMFMFGANLRMKGGDRPGKSDSIQKGWDFANHVMSIDPQSLNTDLPSGRISGTLTFT
jgi:hypothetical protein